ncbi:MAG: 50S ribosomal protein L10 [Chloroflexi bacterium]|nr:50S ribosomal protein L10 [Chloroflexota bacterium]
MPTDAKRETIADLADRIKRSTIAIATDFSGLRVNQLTELRRHLREAGVEYRVVKNRLAARAAAEAGVERFNELLEGVTGLVFGYGEPEAAAKAVDQYVKQTRSPLRIRNGIIEGEVLSAAQINAIAVLPSRQELLAKLLAQLNAPATGLVHVLSGPIRGLAIVLQRHAEQLAPSS